jgi:hypothetical protein
MEASTKPKLQPGNGPRCDLQDRRRLDSLRDAPAEHFEAVFAAIDPKARIPHDVRNRLAERVIGAAYVYRLRSQVEHALPPAQVRKWLKDVAAAAERLLKLLGIHDAESIAKGWPTTDELLGPGGAAIAAKALGGLPWPLGLLLPSMQTLAVERRGDTVTIDALTRMKILLLLLSDLVEVAKRLAKRGAEEPGHYPTGYGGARRQGPSATGAMVRDIIEVYADIRECHPESGPKPGYGPALVGFVRACLHVIEPSLGAVERTTDEMINGHFKSWKKQAYQTG